MTNEETEPKCVEKEQKGRIARDGLWVSGPHVRRQLDYYSAIILL